MMRWLFVLGAMALNTTHAQSGEAALYYHRHSEGWFWYQDPEPEPTAETEEPDVDKPPPADPLATLATFRKRLELAKARAILAPTDDNLKIYLRLNQLAIHRAQDFAQAWQRVVWTTPALDSRLLQPVNDRAVQVFNDEKLRRVDRFLLETARTHGLFFFFKGTCPFCHELAPVLKGFAESYGFGIIPVSLDGGTLPDFPNPRRNADLALKLKVDTVPAVFLVNPRERAIHPVAFGYVSGSELKRRIYTLLNGQPPNPLLQAHRAGARIDANE